MRLLLLAVMFSFPAFSFTLAETNEVVRSMMFRVLADAYDDDWTDEVKVIPYEQRVDTWETFIGGTHVSGWSFEDKKGAFDWYLSTLGTKDCRTLPQGQKDYVLGAISQCHELHYTNAVPYLQALAFNTNGVHRDSAFRNAIRLGQVDDGMTAFVQSIVTNSALFSEVDREAVFAEYSDKLIAMSNDCSLARLNAGRMFYRNRCIGPVGEISVDDAVKACFPLYEISSNRLQTAIATLARSDCEPHVRRYFTTVTNQLLSSGRPLVQLAIGEGENE